MNKSEWIEKAREETEKFRAWKLQVRKRFLSIVLAIDADVSRCETEAIEQWCDRVPIEKKPKIENPKS